MPDGVYQEQGCPSKPQRLLVCNLYAVQRIRDRGERGEAQRRGQRKLWRRADVKQQTAHHGVLPEACTQADHHGRQIHAAAEEPGLQTGRAARWIFQRCV